MIDRACISLGERCNLKCKYCHFHGEYTQKLSGQKQEFNEDELGEIIDNINLYHDIKNGKFKLGIVGSGEPLMEFDKIKYIIDYAKKTSANIDFYTITNAILLDNEKLKFFYEHRDIIKLCVSLDGYEELHNIGREKFQKVYEKIKKYESLFGVKPAINCTVHALSIKNKEKLEKFLVDEKFSDITFSRLFDCHDRRLVITADEYNAFLSSFTNSKLKIRQLDPQKAQKYDCTMYGTLCGVGRTNIFITRRGIYLCGRFYGKEEYNEGSFNTPLIEIERRIKRLTPLDARKCCYDEILG